MTDRRDSDTELATLLSELEGTLTELRGRLDEEASGPIGSTGPDRRRAAGRRDGSPLPRPPFPRPPGTREILRFTEQQTIPTLIAILEANVRLLRLAGAALRAMDPERSVDRSDASTGVGHALETGGRLSADRLSSGLGELQEALSGTEAPNPEARQLLEEAERLSETVRERLRESEGGRSASRRGAEPRSSDPESGSSSGPVQIDVEDVSETGAERDEDEADSGVDVDAELDSIREEIRDDGADEGEPAGEDPAAGSDDENGDDRGTDGDGVADRE